MKRIKHLLLVSSMLFLLTGCVKFNANMDVKKDKSMDLSLIYAIDTSIFGDQNILTDTQTEELEKKGYTIEEYAEGSMNGVKLSRTIKNIDSVSITDDTEYSLSGILEEDNQDSYIFKVKKGFLKNTYIANFKFDTSDSSFSDDESSNSSTMDFSQLEEDDELDTDSDLNSIGGTDFSSMMSNMDLSFNVTVPYSVKSNNATTVSDDNKSLSWKLISSGAENIEFEFELYNMTNIYIIVGIVVLLVTIIIIVIINFTKKNKGQSFLVQESNNNVQSTDISSQTSISVQPSYTLNEFQKLNQSNQPQPEHPTLNNQPIQPTFVNGQTSVQFTQLQQNPSMPIQQSQFTPNQQSQFQSQPQVQPMQPMFNNEPTRQQDSINNINNDKSLM